MMLMVGEIERMNGIDRVILVWGHERAF